MRVAEKAQCDWCHRIHKQIWLLLKATLWLFWDVWLIVVFVTQRHSISNVWRSLSILFNVKNESTCDSPKFGFVFVPDEMYVGKTGLVTGWGTLKEDGKPSCILQEVEVPIMSNDDCTSKTNYTSKMITNNMLCAGYPGVGLRDSCQGDSGETNSSDRS